MLAHTRRPRAVSLLTAGLLAVAPLACLVAPAQADDASAPALTGSTTISSDSWFADTSATTLAQAKISTGSAVAASLGYTGKGVGVALVDTGVVPVQGLTSGNVVNGPDLSFESQSENLLHLDTFGHGTHMAGIIAGHDGTGPQGFEGVAPGAQLTSLKVATHDGAVDVSQVIAAVDWVVSHRDYDPANPIRVLNLSFGTNGMQPADVDPLTHAVENAWRHGIVVVVAGGNSGFGGAKLNNPAYDPAVIAVGDSDEQGTLVAADDTVPGFSSRGDGDRGVDLVAPGRSIVSLRDPESDIDQANRGAVVDGRFFKGSGTSQAAAFVSGAVAQLLQARPNLTPDQVKAVLIKGASRLPRVDSVSQGAGELDVMKSLLSPVPQKLQSYPPSTGLGSLEKARGGQHVAIAGQDLVGEQDIFGTDWNTSKYTWAPLSSQGRAWQGGTWNGSQWTGDGWFDTSWPGNGWFGSSWQGSSWQGSSWQGSSWQGSSWQGSSWQGSSWQGSSWQGSSWQGSSWQGSSWQSIAWAVSSWS
jgi:serine protease AprX